MTEPSEPRFCTFSAVVCVDDLREILAKYGLHLVTDADKRVLDAMGENRKAYAAELARRGEKA